MSARALGKSRIQSTLVGVLLMAAIAGVSLYAEAFSWAANNGVLLNLALAPLAYPAPAPAWTFSVASGLLVAVCASWLLRGRAAHQYARRRAAGVTGAVLLVIALAVQITSPPGWSLDVLNAGQRGAFFLTSSTAFIALAAILLLAPPARPTTSTEHAPPQNDAATRP